jgi:hypothetical protein
VEAAGSEESDRGAVERMLQALRKEKGTLRVAPRGLQVCHDMHLVPALQTACSPHFNMSAWLRARSWCVYYRLTSYAAEDRPQHTLYLCPIDMCHVLATAGR